jgi:hypothetical protein
MSEIILPSRYILTKDTEVGCFAGVAYRDQNGKTRSELLLGTISFLSVQLVGQADKDGIFTVDHIFVERYITQCLKKRLEDVEIFKFYLSRGDFPEIPSDLPGEVVVHFVSPQKDHVWTSYQHISGPYLADTQYISSALSANRLDDISPNVTQNLIPERAHYRHNPQDLPQIGVIVGDDEATVEQKYFEDLIMLMKIKKPTYVN